MSIFIILLRGITPTSEILKRDPFKETDGKRLYFSLLAIEPDKNLLIKFLL